MVKAQLAGQLARSFGGYAEPLQEGITPAPHASSSHAFQHRVLVLMAM